MKQLLIAALLLIAGNAATAQPFVPFILNNTDCDITVEVFCYDPAPACNVVPGSSVTIKVLAHNCFQVPNQNCPPPSQQGYKVCWDSDCSSMGSCVTIDDGTGTGGCYPTSDMLPPCNPCSPAGATVSWVGGHLQVQ